jgi:Skp family chaperone for outer membrane proteins
MLVILAGVSTLGLGVYLGSRLWAQGPGTAAPAQPRIAVVNLVNIMANYSKAKLFQDEAKKAFGKFQADTEDLRKKMGDAQKELEKPDLKQREAWEKYILDLKRALEDVSMKFKKDFGARSEEQAVQLYKEVQDAVQRYAVSNNFHVVLQYNETINPTELNSNMHILRRLERPGGALIPMYVANGLDISAAVVDNLNRATGVNQAGHTPPKK